MQNTAILHTIILLSCLSEETNLKCGGLYLKCKKTTMCYAILGSRTWLTAKLKLYFRLFTALLQIACCRLKEILNMAGLSEYLNLLLYQTMAVGKGMAPCFPCQCDE